MSVVDAHAHLFEKRFLKRVISHARRVGKLMVFEWPRNLRGYNYLQLEEMIKLLSGESNVFFGVSVKVAENPDFEKDILRMENFLENERVVCIKLYPGYDHFYPSERKVERVYELAVKKKVPVVFHSGETWPEIKGGRVTFSHPLNFDMIGSTFPKLKFVMAHMGYPWFNDAIQVVLHNRNAYADLSDILPDSDVLLRKNYQKIVEVVEEFVYRCGSRKLLFACDFGVCDDEYMLEDYISLLNKLDIGKKDKENILFRNAERLFRFKAQMGPQASPL